MTPRLDRLRNATNVPVGAKMVVRGDDLAALLAERDAAVARAERAEEVCEMYAEALRRIGELNPDFRKRAEEHAKKIAEEQP